MPRNKEQLHGPLPDEERLLDADMPWELLDDATEIDVGREHPLENITTEHQTFLRNTIHMLRETLGLEGMQGFRSKCARACMTAIRVVLTLASSVEAFRTMASRRSEQPLPAPDEMIEFVRGLAHADDGHVMWDELGEEKGFAALPLRVSSFDTHANQTQEVAAVHVRDGSHREEQDAGISHEQTAEEIQRETVSCISNLTTGGNLTFFVRENGKEMHAQRPFSQYEFTKDKLLEQIRLGHTITAHGTFDGINATINPEQLPPADREKYERFVHDFTENGQEFVDGYGNEVRIQDPGALLIMLRQPFGEYERRVESHKQLGPEKISLDLRDIGLGRMEGFLAATPPEYLGVVGAGSYHMWSAVEGAGMQSPDASERHAEIERTVEQFSGGIAGVERFFGYRPGSFIDRVVVIPVDKENFFVPCQDPSTIYMTTARAYEGARAADAEYAGRHEALHSVSALLSQMHEHPYWQQFYGDSIAYYEEMIDDFSVEVTHTDAQGNSVAEEVVPNQVDANINERNFFGSFSSTGGHAFENPNELFASFVNSVMDDAWEEKMMDVGSHTKFIVWYVNGLRSLDAIVSGMDTSEIPDDAPIRDALPAKIYMLESMLEHIHDHNLHTQARTIVQK